MTNNELVVVNNLRHTLSIALQESGHRLEFYSTVLTETQPDLAHAVMFTTEN